MCSIPTEKHIARAILTNYLAVYYPWPEAQHIELYMVVANYRRYDGTSMLHRP